MHRFRFYSAVCVAYLVAINGALLTPSPLRAAIILPLVLILPGWLTFSLLGQRHSSRLPHLCYAFGISILELLAIYLTLNSIRVLTHSSYALSPASLTLAEEFLTLLLATIHILRSLTRDSANASCAPRPHSLSHSIHLVVSVALPLLALCGAIRLNNGSGVLALLVPLYILCLFMYALASRRSSPTWFYPAIVLASASALALQYSMRSNYLFGSDIHEEFMAFTIALRNGLWLPSASTSPYNSCLSITALPMALTYIGHLGGYTVFKVVMPLLEAFTAVIVFAIARRVLSPKRALLAAFFFIGYPSFSELLIMHIRTGVALGFFALFILAYFDDSLTRSLRLLLLLVFGTCIILSHYSTAYLFLAVIILWKLVGGYILNRRGGVPGHGLQWKVILFAVLATVVWQAGINHVTGGLKQFTVYASENYEAWISQGASANQANVLGQLLPGVHSGLSPQAELNRYIKTKSRDDLSLQGVRLQALPIPSTRYKLPESVATVIYGIPGLFAKLLKVLIIVAPIFFVFRVYRRRSGSDLPTEFAGLSIACTMVLIGVAVVPYASLSYSLSRTFQMMLIVLSITVVSGVGLLQRALRLRRWMVVVPFVAYFLLYSGLLVTTMGGRPPSAAMSNAGSDYERFYEDDAEYALVQWTAQRYGSTVVLSDETMFRKLQETALFSRLNSSMIVVPVTARDRALVVEGTTNTSGVGYAWLNGESVRYRFPDFSSTKDCIYSSSGGAIYQ